MLNISRFLATNSSDCYMTAMCLVCYIGSVAQRFLARHHTVLQIGSTVFVHGGILPSHADYGLERINRYYRTVVCNLLCMQCSSNVCCVKSVKDHAEFTVFHQWWHRCCSPAHLTLQT